MALFNGFAPWAGQNGLFGGMLEYTGPGGYERLTPEAEAQLAQEAREASAKAFAARNGRAQGTFDQSLLYPTNPVMAPTVTQQLLPQTMPPQQASQPQQAPALPINVPSLRVADAGPLPPIDLSPPAPAPTDVSSRGRMMGQQAVPPPMSQGPDFGSRLNAGLGSFAGAPTLGGAILGGLTGLITGQRNDAYGIAQQNQQLTAKAIFDGLRNSGMPDQQAMGIAMAAAANPEVAKAILPQALGPKEPPKTMEELIARQAYDASRRGGQNPTATAMSAYQDLLRTKAAAEKQGQAQGEVAATLPAALQRGQDALTQIQELLSHPGFDRVFGIVGAFPNIPGGNAAGAQARLNQVKGQAFLDAYQMLKGGGAITEVEGAKATAAKARLEAAQSPEEARIALQDFANAIRAGMQKLKEQAGQAPQTAPVNNGGWTNVAPGVRIRERTQ